MTVLQRQRRLLITNWKVKSTVQCQDRQKFPCIIFLNLLKVGVLIDLHVLPFSKEIKEMTSIKRFLRRLSLRNSFHQFYSIFQCISSVSILFVQFYVTNLQIKSQNYWHCTTTVYSCNSLRLTSHIPLRHDKNVKDTMQILIKFYVWILHKWWSRQIHQFHETLISLLKEKRFL